MHSNDFFLYICLCLKLTEMSHSSDPLLQDNRLCVFPYFTYFCIYVNVQKIYFCHLHIWCMLLHALPCKIWGNRWKSWKSISYDNAHVVQFSVLCKYSQNVGTCNPFIRLYILSTVICIVLHSQLPLHLHLVYNGTYTRSLFLCKFIAS